MKEQMLLTIAILAFIGAGNAASVGVVPGQLDFGEIEPGESTQYNVYIRATNVDQNFTINPAMSTTRHSLLFAEDFRYRDDVSEQSFDTWIDVSETEIDPTSDIPAPDIQMSNPPDVQGRFTFELEVPTDAEPGYREGKLALNPNLTGGGSGAGARVIGATQMYFSFRVPGEVQRDVRVEEVRAFRLGESEAAVEVLLGNEGTVTTSVQNFEVDILDSSRNQETTLQVSGAQLAPGEETWVDAQWESEDQIEQDSNYQIDGEIDFLTGQSTASGSFSLPEFNVVEVRPDNSPGVDSEEEQEGLPLWLVFMVLAILTVLMWSFDIEPFWILAIIGGLAIASFILLSGVSNYLLVVLLMAVGIVIYGVM